MKDFATAKAFSPVLRELGVRHFEFPTISADFQLAIVGQRVGYYRGRQSKASWFHMCRRDAVLESGKSHREREDSWWIPIKQIFLLHILHCLRIYSMKYSLCDWTKSISANIWTSWWRFPLDMLTFFLC